MPHSSPESTGHLTSLSTLGGTQLVAGGRPALTLGKPLALVTYLALTPGRTASREYLLDLLWADLDRERGRHALRQTLWQLRQLLGDDSITGREELHLAIPIDADRDRFLAAIERGDPEAAVEAYQGEFLPDFALPGSTQFEHWAEIERSRLRATFLRAAEMVVRRRMAAGRFREAQELARRMRDADPLNETGWRLLIEALVAGRDNLQVAVEADALNQLLRDESREAEPATQAVLNRVQQATSSIDQDETGTGGLVAELVGREREFSLLLDAWAAAAKGPARHIRLSGAAGLGKTRLLADLARRLRSLGARVLYLRAHQGDRRTPFAFAGDLAQALGPLPGLKAVSPHTADALVGLSPSLSTNLASTAPLRAGPELMRLRTAAVAEAVIEIATEHPLALLVDDVHWLDPESHRLLEGVVQRLDRAPVLVVTAARPGLARMLEEADSTIVELAPLPVSAVRAFIHSLGTMSGTGLLDRVAELLHHSTGGSPLLLVETLQLGLDQGWLGLADGLWCCPDVAAFEARTSRESALTARLKGLDPDAAWILLLLATAGTPLSAAELLEGTRHRDRFDDHLWQLERRGLVQRAGESWEPIHDEIADAILSIESPERRRSAETNVGRILLAGSGVRVDTAIQAVRHLLNGANVEAVSAGFHRLVSIAKEAHDPRGIRTLAAACAGAGSTLTPRQLVDLLPWSVRLGLRRRTVLVAGLLLGAIGASWYGSRGRAGIDQSELVVVRPSRTDSLAANRWIVRLDRSNWQEGRAIDLGQPVHEPGLSVGRSQVVAIHRQGGWVFPRFIDNRRTDDLYLFDGTHTTPLTGEIRDDGGPVWSRDGSEVFFLTARYSEVGADDYDVAAVNPATHEVRRVTNSTDFDETIAVSPSGLLLAITRSYRSLRPRQICWVVLDGTASSCVDSKIGEVSGLLGWLDHRTVLLKVETDAGSRLAEWDIVTNDFKLVGGSLAGSGSVSPDGRWVACACNPDPRGRKTWVVFPSDRPTAYRPLPAADSGGAVAWISSRHGKPAVPELDVSDSSIKVPTGQPYQLTARVRLGEVLVPLPDGALRWRTSDSSVARVDAVSGVLTPGRVGRTAVVVAIGHAADTATVVVEDEPMHAAFRETWETIDTGVWTPLGSPSPRLGRGPGGIPGMHNNGDGSYLSGVVSRSVLNPSRGIGLSARISLPITQAQWQSQGVGFQSTRSLDLAGWDRRTGFPAYPAGAEDEWCSLAYPGAAGMVGIRNALLVAGGRSHGFSVDSTWRRGDWHTVDIQVFPDGTCGFRIDGAPAWRTQAKVPLERGYRVHLMGNSANTNLLVGPLEVWTGVRGDLDWGKSEQLPH